MVMILRGPAGHQPRLGTNNMGNLQLRTRCSAVWPNQPPPWRRPTATAMMRGVRRTRRGRSGRATGFSPSVPPNAAARLAGVAPGLPAEFGAGHRHRMREDPAFVGAAVIGAHDERRHRCVTHDALGGRAHPPAFRAAAAVRAEDQHVGMHCGGEDGRHGRAVDQSGHWPLARACLDEVSEVFLAPRRVATACCRSTSFSWSWVK